MSLKPLIVGEAPSKNGDPATPLQGRVGRRLARWAGLTFEEYLELFDRVNLMPVRVEVDQKLIWDHDKMNRRADDILNGMLLGQKALLLGRRVQGAFGLEAGYFAPNHVNGVVLYALPHPSGLNRFFNESENDRHMGEFLRNIIEDIR